MKMATSSELTTNIEGIYSTTPRVMTEPRFSYKISVLNNQSLANDQDHHGILQKRMHIILCYKKQSSSQDSGLHIGGRLKESLGSALLEHPILAGRLRRSENGGLEIVSNDSGIRCVEAQMPLSLDEFLESKEKKSDVEDMLVYWQDIEKSNPQFSPLFYVQVTKFQCGGYSLGISYSLLLTDPSNMAKFLNRWAEIHRSMASESEFPKLPLSSYAPTFKKGWCPELEYGTTHFSRTSRTTSKTIIFTIDTNEKLDDLGDEICKNFMLLCLEEAENKFGIKMTSTFTLITKKPDGDTTVELFSKQGNNFCSPKSLKYELNYLSWEDLRMDEVAFQKENVMVDEKRWTGCDALEGVAVVVISSRVEGKSDLKVYITFPGDQEIF